MPNNQLTGNIPPELSQLNSLILLNVRENQLSGNIPVSLGDLNTILSLDLSFNQLTGAIPASLGNLTTLFILNLDNNILQGSIPGSLGNLSSIIHLSLNNNELTGCYEDNLSSLCNLLAPVYNKNESVSEGNLLDAPWEDFCDNGSGGCDGGNSISGNDGDMFVSLDYQHSNCLTAGEVTVTIAGGKTPHSILWNTGHQTTTVADLSPGFYSVDVFDSQGLHVNMDIEIEGQYLPIYDDDGNQIDCLTFNCPTLIDFGATQPAGMHHADQAINTSGSLGQNESLTLKAGNKIELDAGFEISIGSTFEVLMEYCN